MALCNRCGECVQHCPQAVLVQWSKGFPEIDFSLGECVFCARCVEVCKPAALKKRPEQHPWPYQAEIAQHCLAQQGVECRVCQEHCAQDAIHFTPVLQSVTHPRLDPQTCNACGACVAPCPAQAIRIVQPVDGVSQGIAQEDIA